MTDNKETRAVPTTQQKMTAGENPACNGASKPRAAHPNRRAAWRAARRAARRADHHQPLSPYRVPKGADPCMLYVGNVSNRATGGDLWKALEPFGDIAGITRPLKDATRLAPYAFVRMRTPQGAQVMIGMAGGLSLAGRNLIVRIAFPKNRNPRKQQNREGQKPRKAQTGQKGPNA